MIIGIITAVVFGVTALVGLMAGSDKNKDEKKASETKKKSKRNRKNVRKVSELGQMRTEEHNVKTTPDKKNTSDECDVHGVQHVSSASGDSQPEHLLQGARPRTSARVRFKSENVSVKFYDWSSGAYLDKDPILVQFAKEFDQNVRSSGVTGSGSDVKEGEGAHINTLDGRDSYSIQHVSSASYSQSEYFRQGARPKIRTRVHVKSEDHEVESYDRSSRTCLDRNPSGKGSQSIESGRVTHIRDDSRTPIASGDSGVKKILQRRSTNVTDSALFRQGNIAWGECKGLVEEQKNSGSEQQIGELESQMARLQLQPIQHLRTDAEVGRGSIREGVKVKKSSIKASCMQYSRSSSEASRSASDFYDIYGHTSSSKALDVANYAKYAEQKRSEENKKSKVSSYVRSTEVSHVVRRQSVPICTSKLPSFDKYYANRARLEGDTYHRKQKRFRCEVQPFTMMHFQYACFMFTRIFYMRQGIVHMNEGILSFLLSRIRNVRLCVFVLKVACVIHCAEMANTPSFVNRVIYSSWARVFHREFDEYFARIVFCMQEDSPSFLKVCRMFHGSYKTLHDRYDNLHDGTFFHQLLQLLCELVHVRLGDPGCPKEVLDLAILTTAQMFGAVYNSHRYIQSVITSAPMCLDFSKIVENMGSTEYCAGNLGEICYTLLCRMLYMYNINYNEVIYVHGIPCPKAIIDQCSECFCSKVESSIRANTMGFHMFVEDLAMRICRAVGRSNLFSCEQEIGGYSKIYDELARRSIDRGPQR